MAEFWEETWRDRWRQQFRREMEAGWRNHKGMCVACGCAPHVDHHENCPIKIARITMEGGGFKLYRTEISRMQVLRGYIWNLDLRVENWHEAERFGDDPEELVTVDIGCYFSDKGMAMAYRDTLIDYLEEDDDLDRVKVIEYTFEKLDASVLAEILNSNDINESCDGMDVISGGLF